MTILANIKTIQLKENGAPKKFNEWEYIKKKKVSYPQFL